jgi:serine/threonine protein kinase
MPPHERSSARLAAEEIYVQALSLGGPIDVAELARANPASADELNGLHAEWERVAGIHAALAAQGSLTQRLRKHYGAAVEADLELDDSDGEADSLASRAVRELEAHAPRQSRYRLLGEVARGGMGAVLKVWDSDLNRALAMKVMLAAKGDATDPDSRFDRDRALARFLEEAQVTGQLDHPGIVPVHEMGLDATGRVFFTMRLVRGNDLEHILGLVARGAEGWTIDRALRVLQRMCEAMAFAHSKGVVHRDLKPANVMVGRFGEVYVMDWGLARVLGREDKADLRVRRRDAPMLSIVKTVRTDERAESVASPLMTMDGEVLGTPAYMAPEQARGELERLDQRADVYSAGAILYHLLAGHMPYVEPGAKRGAFEVWEMAQAGPPAALADRARRAPAELVAIAEKAMQRRPEDRYPTMMELAEDLTSFLDGRVVHAYETGAVAELKKWVRRNRLSAAALLAALLVALGGLGSVTFLKTRSNRTLAQKNDELSAATAAAQKARGVAEEQRERADDNARLADAERRDAVAARGEAEQRAREVARERDSGEKVIEFLVQLFESPDPSRARGAEITAKELLDRGAGAISARAENEGPEWSRLRVAMGRAYQSLGLYADARPLLERALAERRAERGETDPATLRSAVDLARLYVALGHYADAEPLLLASSSGWDPAREADAEARLDTADALGMLRFYQGRYPEAIEILGRAAAGWKALAGPLDPDTLRTTRNLALVHRKAEAYYDAQELLERVLAGMRGTLGDDHPETLQAMNDLAGVYVFQGERDRALPLFEEALAGRIRVLGEGHPDTLVTLNDLAYLHLQNGDFDAAEPLYEQAIEGKKLALGPAHPETLTSMNNLAALYYEKRRYPEAEALYRAALAGTLEARGENHPHSAGVLFGLASALFSQGRFADAEPFYARAHASARNAFGADNENTQVILESYVRLLIERAEWPDAEVHALELVKHTPQTHVAFPSRRALLERIRAALDEG